MQNKIYFTKPFLALLFGLALLIPSGVAGVFPWNQVTDPCPAPECECSASANALGGPGGPVTAVGTHDISGTLLATISISPQNGYTTGQVPGKCNDSAKKCDCETKGCGYHYSATITINGWGSIDPQQVSKVTWHFQGKNNDFNLSSGLPSSFTSDADLSLVCGSLNVKRKLTLTVTYLDGTTVAVNAIQFSYSCAECPGNNQQP